MFEWFVRRSKIVRRTIQLPRRARVYNPLKRGGWAESLSVCGFVRDFKNSLLLKTRTGTNTDIVNVVLRGDGIHFELLGCLDHKENLQTAFPYDHPFIQSIIKKD